PRRDVHLLERVRLGRAAVPADRGAAIYRALRRGQPLPLVQVLRVRGHGELRPDSLRDAALAAAAAPLPGQDPRSQGGAGPPALACRWAVEPERGRAVGGLLGIRRPYSLISRRMSRSQVVVHASPEPAPPATP